MGEWKMSWWQRKCVGKWVNGVVGGLGGVWMRGRERGSEPGVGACVCVLACRCELKTGKVEIGKQAKQTGHKLVNDER